jgi:hypothetical protein
MITAQWQPDQQLKIDETKVSMKELKKKANGVLCITRPGSERMNCALAMSVGDKF